MPKVNRTAAHRSTVIPAADRRPVSSSSAPRVGSNTPQVEANWIVMYGHLQEFYRIHGHCNVPKSYCTKLSNWASGQRYSYRTGKTRLSPERRKLLHELDPRWHSAKKARNDWTYNSEAVSEVGATVHGRGRGSSAEAETTASGNPAVPVVPVIAAAQQDQLEGCKPNQQSRCSIY
jgi:hypothetical protein